MRYYSNIYMKQMIKQLNENFNSEDLKLLLHNFKWNNEDLPNAWQKRLDLEQQMKEAISSNNIEIFKDVIKKIYFWGFNKKLPDDIENNNLFWIDLNTLLKELNQIKFIQEVETEIKDKISLLINKVLDVKGVGLASLSKWICFLDQDRFAIYDSRVSIALRNIHIDTEFRAFPIMARRPLKNKIAWPSDTQIIQKSNRTSRMYIDYLCLLNQFRQKYHINLKVAQIEMALFVKGDVWSSKPENNKLTSIMRGMWS